jgi:hypothetical protein
LTFKFKKFPVFFPVSREFSQRKVSARLHAPPCSLNCREIPAPLTPKYADKSGEHTIKVQTLDEFMVEAAKSISDAEAVLAAQIRNKV